MIRDTISIATQHTTAQHFFKPADDIFNFEVLFQQAWYLLCLVGMIFIFHKT